MDLGEEGQEGDGDRMVQEGFEAEAGVFSKVDSVTGSPEDLSPGTLHGTRRYAKGDEFGSWVGSTEGWAAVRSPSKSPGEIPFR